MAMKRQFVVFGVDRFGASVARTLENNGVQVIAVDSDPERIQAIADDVSYAMTADVEDPEAVSELGLKNVDGAVISMVEHMEASVITAMVCMEMGIKEVFARASNQMHGKILEKIGVTKVVYPEQEMGERMGRYIAALDFMDWISLSPDFSLVEAVMQPEWVGKTLADLNLRSKFGLNVVGIRKGEQIDMRFDPHEKLTEQMILYVIGSNEDLRKIQTRN